ncbi:hypothetical protein Tco_0099920 [Tanacetum coccineum]
MVAFLEKSTRSAGFHQIIDFLNRSHICYALTKKPDVCVFFIKQFWRSAEVSTAENGEVKITATIDSHSLTITEGSLRRHLKLDDRDGLSSIPNSEIFEQLARMGYNTDSDKLNFQKGWVSFSPQWRAEHHFPTPHDSPLHAVHSHGSDEGRLQLNELMNLVTKLSDRIGALEGSKKLESQLKTRKARRKARVVLSDDEVIQDDSSKQGRKLSKEEVQEKASIETKLFIQEVTLTEVIQAQEGSEKESDEVSIAGAKKGTASEEAPIVSTSEVNLSTAGQTVTYSRRSAEKRSRQDEGKAIMIESEPDICLIERITRTKRSKNDQKLTRNERDKNKSEETAKDQSRISRYSKKGNSRTKVAKEEKLINKEEKEEGKPQGLNVTFSNFLLYYTRAGERRGPKVP